MKLGFPLAFAALLSLPHIAAAASAGDDVILKALKSELARSKAALSGVGKAPMYYLGYEARDTRAYGIGALLGAVRYETDDHTRSLDVDVRIGAHQLDNTHQLKGRQGDYEWDSGPGAVGLTIDDDPDALRAAMWLLTDAAYKRAQNRYTKVKTNKAVTADEEDKSDDFSTEDPVKHYDSVEMPRFDRKEWAGRLRRLSREVKKYPFIIDSNVTLSIRAENRYIVNSEGAEVVTGNRYVRLSYTVRGRTADGMDISRFLSYNADRPQGLPDDAAIARDMHRSAAELQALLTAPLAEPYTGPAIFRNKATGVFFHEILGHRLEGHRQKLAEEGQTFTKKLGLPVTVDFISVYDDATLERFRGTALRGFYRFDDEGIPARRVSLVENGILKGFLLSRSPIKGFPRSNGHGRRSAGRQVVARMGNTLIEASRTLHYDELRTMLIDEIKKQDKPYGLIFDDISGGFTNTSRSGAQSFKVEPLLVYRVYPDGRPDEAVRGVDIVGTPQTSFFKILAAADDPGIFNGTCGAESGWVPVSAVAPSILVSEIEIEKKLKSAEKPPLLPPPFHDPQERRGER